MRGIWTVLLCLLFSQSLAAFPFLNEEEEEHQLRSIDEDSDFIIIEDDDEYSDHLDGFNRQGRQAFSSPQGAKDPVFEQACLTRTGRLGQCTSLKVCYPYFKMPGAPNQDSTPSLGLYDSCSYVGEQGQQVFGVCCTGEQRLPPGEPTSRPTQPPKPTPPGEEATKDANDGMDFELHESEEGSVTDKEEDNGIRTSPDETANPKFNTGYCSARFYNNNLKIVNGEDASLNEYPFMAALFNRNRHFCGGSIIDPKHILTAAHCVAHMTKSDVRHLRVHLGEHDIKSNYETGVRKLRVQRIIRHKRFSASTLHNDVAILTLRESVSYFDAIQPICLATDNSVRYEGDAVTVAGWGTIGEGGRQSRTLQKVDVTVWRNFECAASYGNRAPGGIQSHMLCASRPGKDSCSGDSGGPLFICEGVCTQVGIVSWGIGCAREQFPGVYTRVTALYSWIEKIRKNH
uniref:Trypsin-1 n=1 Tax=Caligus clemensi TaxID=344056 RepID=C1C1Y5_CALCM|nr:Trypsin-1 precursor [Caligus clemensi]